LQTRAQLAACWRNNGRVHFIDAVFTDWHEEVDPQLSDV
jgi:hypothetical protein